ncbi:hypothetical protein Rifp1Sym_dx00070 [endosymbiont of Riftia pachyptila (vent Ph05)]|uniref:Uncharacterized protein n=1 Tax=endosymbiont of Riftia pachyptila (vent Ph05) TaxID=1048808 RepID=G2DGU2_9GAMM|nr:hypothetical protein Rifp1Sym_dx00070 [endosymbiont of Riftia pachyptila (vent Ph05)]
MRDTARERDQLPHAVLRQPRLNRRADRPGLLCAANCTSNPDPVCARGCGQLHHFKIPGAIIKRQVNEARGGSGDCRANRSMICRIDVAIADA